jgi:transcriptional regulator with XRE-family HTH domain
MSTFADRVRHARSKRGLSQRDLAKQAQIDHAWVSRLEAGERNNISLLAAKRLAEALQVSLDYLAGMYEEKA